MTIGFSVQDAVRKRYSVRSFDKHPVENDVREKLLAYASALQNPLGPHIRVQFVEKRASEKAEKLGTYGVIGGAKLYLAVTVPDDAYAPEALGYEFEQLLLYATSLGLGSCWLGGTFRRSAFAEAIDIKENELFPIISPIGYPAEKKRAVEKLFRRSLKADARLPWNTLFFADNFETPLLNAEAGDYTLPLEMLRLAPSATNKQPWRVVRRGKAFHFFMEHSLGTAGAGSVDMQRIDLGIAICHFHLTALENHLSGAFERCLPSDLQLTPNTSYVTSWIAQ